MKIKVQKWGNSLALRIPKAFAENADLSKGSVVDLSEKGKKIIIKPICESEPTLKQLLAGITRKNIHREVETQGPVGNELW
ncbi:MAG: AbrB/MazE/SpoVT family DNA-binding domain-containing protein [bacterium]